MGISMFQEIATMDELLDKRIKRFIELNMLEKPIMLFLITGIGSEEGRFFYV